MNNMTQGQRLMPHLLSLNVLLQNLLFLFPNIMLKLQRLLVEYDRTTFTVVQHC